MKGLLIIFFTHAACADIFLCRHDNGEVLFTDVHCTDGELVERSVFQPSPAAGLSAAELRAVARLDAKLTVNALQRSQARRRARGAMRRDDAKRASACAAANKQIDGIRATKRSGYSLLQAAKLDAAEARYRAMREENC